MSPIKEPTELNKSHVSIGSITSAKTAQPSTNTNSRRKTAKEIASMYETLKQKYIEKKKEWTAEKAELLKKAGVAEESQILLSNMKDMANG